MAKRIVDEEMRFSIIVNGDKAQKELYDLEKKTRDLTGRNKELRAEQARMVKQGQKNTQAYKNLTSEIRANNKEIKVHKARMSELQKEIGVTGLTLGQLLKRASALRLQLRNMVPGSAQYKRYNKELKEVNAQLGKLRVQSRASAVSLSSLANGFNKYAALGASFLATLTGVVVGLQKMIDFNSKLSDAQSDVQKTTGMTKEEVDDLTKSMGLLQTRTNRINLLKIAEEGGRIGIAKEEIEDFVNVMDKAVVALGDSFPGGAEETASKLGKLKLLFNETKDQGVVKAYNAIGSAINELGAQGVATEVNIANFATRVGSLPESLKPSISSALALGAGFEESGIQAEIAGRAYSILLTQAAEESGKFAEVMGLSADEVERMINEDSLSFLIQFARGLKGMTATDTANTLKYLGVQADGANKVLGALSNNTDRFIDLMKLSNTSMREGTSLINEYNIKNNNFAATLDRIGKKLRGYFALGLARPLESVVGWFGELLGVVQDLDEEMITQAKQSFENAKANRELASSSQKLLEEYETLTKDGLEPSKKEKERLEEITVQLRDRLGEEVVAINQETGAMILNTEAVKENIKLKRLAADEEAATIASRLQGVISAQEELKEQLKTEENLLDVRRRLREKAVSEFSPTAGTQRGQLGQKARLPEVKQYNEQLQKTSELRQRILKLDEQGVTLLKQLQGLNFSLDDVNALFAPSNTVAPTITNPETDGPGGYTPPGGTDPKNRAKSLLQWQQETEDARIAIIQDSFRRELEEARVAHERKIALLQSQKVTGVANATEINAEINKQIELATESHNYKIAAIYENGLAESIKKRAEAFELEKSRAETAYNEELTALGNNEAAKQALKEDYQRESLAREEAYLREVLDNIAQIEEAGNMGGMDLSILTPEQVAAFSELADQLKLKLSELGIARSALTGGGGGKSNFTEGGADSAATANAQLENNVANTDILGFTIEDWAIAFDHLDTYEEKLMAIGQVTQSLMNAWSMYADFQRRNNQLELRNYEKLQDQKSRALQENFDKGYINQRQYEEGVRALEEETANKQAELEYKQAKADRDQAIAQAIIGTSLAIIQAYAQLGPIGGTIAAAFIGTLGAVQIGMIRKQPLPVKGFEQGYYGNMPVQREQDGKMFNAAYGGTPTTQTVSRPTVFMAGEQGRLFPELIIDGRSFSRFDPNFKQALYGEIARVKGFEGGYYQTSTPTPTHDNQSSTEERQMMLAVLNETNLLLKDLRENPIQAVLSRNMRTAKELREDIKEYENLRSKNKR